MLPTKTCKKLIKPKATGSKIGLKPMLFDHYSSHKVIKIRLVVVREGGRGFNERGKGIVE
jgi:hypothetical protein